ncbi:hypothetical protein U1Q18_047785 [Sarracenia purpurea var. burkii]
MPDETRKNVVVPYCLECGYPLVSPVSVLANVRQLIAAQPCGHVYHRSCFMAIFRTTPTSEPDMEPVLCTYPDCGLHIQVEQFMVIALGRKTVQVHGDADKVADMQLRLDRADLKIADLTLDVNNTSFRNRELASSLTRANEACAFYKKKFEEYIQSSRDPVVGPAGFYIYTVARARKFGRQLMLYVRHLLGDE